MVESAVRRALVGNDRDLLVRMAKDAGIDPENCAFTHAVLCHTKDVTATHRASCLHNLQKILDVFPKAGIVFVGAKVKRYYERKLQDMPSTYMTSLEALIIGGGCCSPLYLENINRLKAFAREVV